MEVATVCAGGSAPVPQGCGPQEVISALNLQRTRLQLRAFLKLLQSAVTHQPSPLSGTAATTVSRGLLNPLPVLC